MDNMMNPYSNHMYQQRMNQFSQPQNLIRVNGIGGANAYQMSANSTVALFDYNEDIMYIKTTDGAGFPNIRTFRFEEISQNNPSVDYVKKDEFEQFRKEIMEVMAYGKQSISRKSNDEHTEK